MTKNNPLIFTLTAVVLILAGAMVWLQGTRDCEKHFAPMETRYMPLEGCLIKMGSQWRSERELRNNIQQGLQEMKDGGQKVMEGIFGKQPPQK